MTVSPVLERSACIEWLFREGHSFADRIRLAAAAKLPSVEFWTWRDKDMAAIDAIFTRNDVVTEPPGWLEDDPAD